MYDFSKIITNNKKIIDNISDIQLKKNTVEIHTLTLWFHLLGEKKIMARGDFAPYCKAVLGIIQAIDTQIDINLIIESLEDR
jgi:hypothetical protein